MYYIETPFKGPLFQNRLQMIKNNTKLNKMINTKLTLGNFMQTYKNKDSLI